MNPNKLIGIAAVLGAGYFLFKDNIDHFLSTGASGTPAPTAADTAAAAAAAETARAAAAAQGATATQAAAAAETARAVAATAAAVKATVPAPAATQAPPAAPTAEMLRNASVNMAAAQALGNFTMTPDQWSFYKNEKTGVQITADLFTGGNRAEQITAVEYLNRTAQAGLSGIQRSAWGRRR
jgi:hypothetical protein